MVKFSEDRKDILSKVLTMPNRHAEVDTRNDPSVWIRTFIYTAECCDGIGRYRQENQEAILGYTVSCRPAWDT